MSTSTAPERSRKVTLTLKTVNSVFFLLAVRDAQVRVEGLIKRSVVGGLGAEQGVASSRAGSFLSYPGPLSERRSQ